MTSESTSPSPPLPEQAAVGVSPAHDRALRAIKALAEDRLDDALRNAEAIPGDQLVDRAWKALLYGQIGLARGDLQAAEWELRRAAALGLECGVGDTASAAEMLRLAALAMNDLGRVCRRREKLREAEHAHHVAYRLRVQCGSEDEQWESAMDLGVDHHLARQFESAAVWHNRSLQHAQRAAAQPRCKQAQAFGRLSPTLLALGRLEEAVSAARSARALWREHDAGCADGFRAELQVGHALLVHAQAHLDAQPSKARLLLDESLRCLASARDELAAFGAETLADVRSCEDRLDFAGRLRASLD